MSDITRARDILREMRPAATPGPWQVHDVGDEGWEWSKIVAPSITVSDHGTQRAAGVASVHAEPADATLIVVLAGNPAFLDAIDGMLALGERLDRKYRESWLGGTDIEVHQHAERIASAIVSGWEKVQR